MQHPFKERDATCATQNAGNSHHRVRGHLHSTYSDTCAGFEPVAGRAKPGPQRACTGAVHLELKIPDTWGDGDSWAINYVGHPIHGAASGFIWLDHEDGAHDPKFAFSKEYWTSRGRATAWAAVYTCNSSSAR